MLLNITRDKKKSVLFSGSFSDEFYCSLQADRTVGFDVYNSVAAQLERLLCEGYDTFLFYQWNSFAATTAFNLVCRQSFCSKSVFLYGVFDTQMTDLKLRESQEKYFNEIIYLDQENIELSDTEKYRELLGNVSLLAYCNKHNDPGVPALIAMAVVSDIDTVDLTK